MVCTLCTALDSCNWMIKYVSAYVDARLCLLWFIFQPSRMLGFDRPLYEIIMPVSSRLFNRISHGEEMRWSHSIMEVISFCWVLSLQQCSGDSVWVYSATVRVESSRSKWGVMQPIEIQKNEIKVIKIDDIIGISYNLICCANVALSIKW